MCIEHRICICSQIFGVEEGDAFSIQECKKEYKKKALENHPDRGGDPERFKKLKAAYDWIIERLESHEGSLTFNGCPSEIIQKVPKGMSFQQKSFETQIDELNRGTIRHFMEKQQQDYAHRETIVQFLRNHITDKLKSKDDSWINLRIFDEKNWIQFISSEPSSKKAKKYINENFNMGR